MVAKEILYFKNIEDDYDRAYQLVSYLFRDKIDKAGLPYIDHLISVSAMLDSSNIKIAGLLHDTIEDISNFTLDDLRLLGFSEDVVEIVRIVTRDKTKKKSYHDWISEIIETKNIDAIKVKYADLIDHLNLERLNRLDEVTRLYFIKKYSDEVTRLQKVLIAV